MAMSSSLLRITLARKILTTQRFIHILSYAEELERRSLLQKSYPSDLLSSWKEETRHLPAWLYAGFDPTADSLHIGNLLILLNLIRGAQFDCKPIAVVGEYTAQIGDPSGRKTARNPISKENIHKNTSSITDQIRKIGENCLRGTGKELMIVNNYKWTADLFKEDGFPYHDLCRDFKFSIMRRLGAVKNRSTDEDGISHTEIGYQILQAHDWLQLSDRFSCRFQIGGSDQLGHLDLGAHYIKQKRENAFAAGVCLPLLTDKDGNKLGKSVGGGIWLSAKKTSSFHFYQYFRQLHDSEAEDLLKKFSLRPFEDVEEILDRHRQQLGKWIAQEELATELTRLVHGEEGLETAFRCSRAVFEKSIDDITSLSSEELCALFGEPLNVEAAKIKTVGDFADATRQTGQKGSALMTKGALKINGVRVMEPQQKFDAASVILPRTSSLILICWGKRNFQLVNLRN